MALEPRVRTVAVIGAGAIGQGIAQLAVLGGYRTILEDILPAALRRADNKIRSSLDEAVRGGALLRHKAEAALSRIEYASSIDYAAREADLVIESVPDEMDSKIEILTLLDRTCRPGTIFVTNSSAFTVAELASVTYRAPCVVGMRFTHPVTGMKVLPIERTSQTEEGVVAAARELGTRMGMDVVVVGDSASREPSGREG